MTDLLVILPELVMVGAGCAVLILDLVLPKGQKDLLAYFSLMMLLVAFYGTYRLAFSPTVYAFSGMFVLDPFSNFFKLLLYLATALTILISIRYLEIEHIHLGEYYAFILFSTSGMMIMVSGADLITIYLGLELMSLSLYILSGFKRYERKSIEASAKYFVLGSFSSGVLLFGISLLYGLSGSTQLKDMGKVFETLQADSGPALLLAMILLVVGFGFKVAAVPFHMWTPDVYEGAPTSVTAYMSVATKSASFAAFMRVFLEALGPIEDSWRVLLIALSVATMAVGNVVAIVQTNIKRMLAYSSIAHAGYALIGLVVGSDLGIFSLMLYMAIYTLMNLGAFGVVILLRGGGDEISDFTGLARNNRLAAFVMLVFMFSLTGIPPTAGFVGKFYIFMAAVESGLAWLAVVGVLFSAVSAYYYLRIVMLMYMKEPETQTRFTVSPAVMVALWVATLAILGLGVYPSPLVEYAQTALLRVPQIP
ncbi:MAG: NADH-quinone oxidoreductase subunit N [Nitrospira sp.]|nr:NADH-quinone oxidoreductase subunit N [Nitrospira sp.]